MSAEQAPAVEYEVPADESPATRCPYCDRPFRSERYATFHVGVRHPEECTATEREAFEDECDAEEYELFTFHVKTTILVLVTYFVFTYLYALAWTG